ncbi:MAG: fibronectin type III domain-containing protein, partial [Planctomycetia bacterium]
DVDLDGNDRISYDSVDIGAYEYKLAPVVDSIDGSAAAIMQDELFILEAILSDPGLAGLYANDTFYYSIDWGDGSQEVGLRIDDIDGTFYQDYYSGDPPVAETLTRTVGQDTESYFWESHIYEYPGYYTITVAVWDDQLAQENATLTTLEVQVQDIPLIYEGDAETNAYSLDFTYFDAGTISSMVIDWGDGTTSSGDSTSGWGDDITLNSDDRSGTATHTYADDGTYAIEITYNSTTVNMYPLLPGDADLDGDVDGDDLGILSYNWESEETTWLDGDFNDDGTVDILDATLLARHWEMSTGLDVFNVSPTIAEIEDQYVDEDSTLSFSVSFTDPGFDNSPGSTAEAFEYVINWGDETSDTGRVGGDATDDDIIIMSGSAGIDTLGLFKAGHTYTEAGVYMVDVTLYDDDGGYDTQSFTVYYGVPVAATLSSVNDTSNTTADLEWTCSSGSEIGFAIEKSTDGTNFEFAGWADANETTYTVTGLTANTTYYFRVNAYNDIGPMPSNSVSDQTEDNLPLTPTNFAVEEWSDNQVYLIWTPNATSEQDSFIVEQSLDGENFTTADTTEDNFADLDDLSPNTTYYYRVKSHNTIGDSSYSDIIQVTTTPEIPDNLTAISESTSEIRLLWNPMQTLTPDLSDIVDFAQTGEGNSLYIKDETSALLAQIVGYADSDVGDDYSFTTKVTIENTSTELGLLARGDISQGNGYILTLDPTTPEFKLVKLVSGVPQTPALDAETLAGSITVDETYKIEFEVNGSTLTGKLYDSSNNLLSTLQETDSTYTTGSIGTWASKQGASSIEGTWSELDLSQIGQTSGTMPTLTLDSSDILTFTQSEDGTQLYVEDVFTTPLTQVIGYADSDVGDDYLISGDIKFENLYTEHGFLVRADAEYGHGYVLTLDPDSLVFSLAEYASGSPTVLVSHDLSSTLSISVDDILSIEFEVLGTSLAGRLYDADGALIDVINAVDDTYTTGYIGTWAEKGTGAAIKGTWSALNAVRFDGQLPGYIIEQSIDNETFTEVATAWTTDVTMDNLALGTQYYFRVRAYDDSGNVEYSNTANATTTLATTLPSAPSVPGSSIVISDSTTATLSWIDNSDNETGFRIEVSTDGTNYDTAAITLPDTETWTFPGLVPNTRYYFHVFAHNNEGNSACADLGNALTGTIATPIVATPASASLNTAQTSATLSVLGADNGGEAALTYTWAVTMLPEGASEPDFSPNGTDESQDTSVTFHAAGTYWFTVTITDGDELSTTSSVSVTVDQIPDDTTGISISADSTNLESGETLELTVVGEDQFGDPLVALPVIWDCDNGIIDSNGLFTAPSLTTNPEITVDYEYEDGDPEDPEDNLTDSLIVYVTNHAPTIVNEADAYQVPATDTISLSALAEDIDLTGDSGLTYTWTYTTKPSGSEVTFSDENGTNEGQYTIATVDMLGTYEFQVTISDGDSSVDITSSYEIEVVQSLTTITVSPTSPTVEGGATQQFTAAGYDQFGDPMETAPVFDWSATSGSIDYDGLYTAPHASLPITVTASSNGVSESVSVVVGDASPTTSARQGDDWMQTWWEMTLGCNETYEYLIDLIQGNNTLALDASTPGNGFIIDPTSPFMLSNPTASSGTFPNNPAATTHTWIVDGVVYTSIEDFNYSLSYEITGDANGWTYTENYTFYYDIVTTADGAAFSHLDGSYAYAFTAMGDTIDSDSVWDYAVHVNAPAISPADDNYQWGQTVETHDYYSNETLNLVFIRSGSASGSGGTTWFDNYGDDGYSSTASGGKTFEYEKDYTYSSGAGWSASGSATNVIAASGSSSYPSDVEEYSDSGVGWSCSGTVSEGGTDQWQYSYTTNYDLVSGSWSATSGSGGSSGSGNSQYSYDETGEYWPSEEGEYISGTYADSSVDNTEYEYTTTASFSGGAWSESGSGTVSQSGSGSYRYSGDGYYEKEVAETVTGTGYQEEEGHDKYEYNEVVEYEFASGTWQASSGSGTYATYTEEWDSLWKYTVNGTPASGTIKEEHEEKDEAEYDENYTLDANGKWQLVGGDDDPTDGDDIEVHAWGNGYTNKLHTTSSASSEDGNGPEAGGTWLANGTITDKDGDDISWDYDSEADYNGSNWSYSGSGSVTNKDYKGHHFEGSGSYTDASSNPIGTVEYETDDNSFFSYTTYYGKNASTGEWEETSLTRESSGHGYTDWSYTGSGSAYSASGDDWSVTGIQSSGEGVYKDYDYLVRASRDIDALAWGNYEGYTDQSYSETEHSSYSASGSYSRSVNYPYSGTITGSVEKDGYNNDQRTYATHSELNASGIWGDPTITKSAKGDSEDNWAYSSDPNSGSYSMSYDNLLMHWIPLLIDGTIQENGYNNYSREYDATWTLGTGNTWSASGYGITASDSNFEYSYSGSGSNSGSEEVYIDGSVIEFFVTASQNGTVSSRSQHIENWTPAGEGWALENTTDFSNSNADESFDYNMDEYRTYPDPYEVTHENEQRHFDSNTDYSLQKTNGIGFESELEISNEYTKRSFPHAVDTYGFVGYAVTTHEDWFSCRDESITNYYEGGSSSLSTIDNFGEGDLVVYYGPTLHYSDDYDEPLDYPGYYPFAYFMSLYENHGAYWFNLSPPITSGLSYSYTPKLLPEIALCVAEGAEGEELGLTSTPVRTPSFSMESMVGLPEIMFGSSRTGGPSFTVYGDYETGPLSYDSLGRLTKLTDANDAVTRFTYNGESRLAGLTDPVGNTTEWVYDDEGRLIQETNELGDSRYYVYDDAGDLVRYIDRNGGVREYTYDAEHRVVMEAWYADVDDANAAQDPENVLYYTYDSAGHMTAAWDDTSLLTYSYDTLGRVTQAGQEIADGPTVSMTPFYFGTETDCSFMTVKIDGRVDHVDSYTYDADGQVLSVTQAGVFGGNAVAEKRADFTYNDDGQVLSIERY